jgi:membrane dipeptidase
MNKEISKLTQDEKDHALNLYKESIVVDCHLDSVIKDDYISQMLESGVTAVNLDGGSFNSLAEKIRLIREHPNKFIGPVTRVTEIINAKKDGKIAVLLGSEDAVVLLDASEKNTHFYHLPLYYELGLRIIQPCYNDRNLFADGCAENQDSGLSDTGSRLIDEINSLNMIVDCSHVSNKTTLEICERADFVVSTHSNSFSVCENPRNRTDEEIKAIAEKDGVLGIVSFPTFVKWTKTTENIWPTIEDLLDHVDYIDGLVGIKHVGIGLDLVEGTGILGPVAEGEGLARWPNLYGAPNSEGFYKYADGLNTIVDLPNIAIGLVTRGYSDDEIKGVLGMNWLRVFRRSWGE